MDKSKVIETIKSGITDIVFEKKDGTLREMKCTLKDDMLPVVEDLFEGEAKAVRKANPDVFSVWDIVSEGWRSFRWDSLKTVNGETFTDGSQ